MIPERGGGYVELFGADLEALSKSEFDRLFGAWLICDFVSRRLGEDKKRNEDVEDDDDSKLRRRALERKYLVFYAVGEILREVAKLRAQDFDVVLRSFCKPKWMSEKAKVAVATEAYYLACDMVVQAYQGASKHPNFVHRNFFRAEETLRDIRGTKASRRSALTKIADEFSEK